MATWEATSPENWTMAFGLVAVPYFSRTRSGAPVGQHRMMQDGPAASFALHITAQKELTTSRLPLEWAWSSHVRHTVVLDATTKSAAIRRWDEPDYVERRSFATEREADKFLRSLERERARQLPGDVIEKTLRSFSLLRDAIEQRGGTSLDVILAFNSALLLAEKFRESPASLSSVSLSKAIANLAAEGRAGFRDRTVSPVVQGYALGEFVRILLGDGIESPYLLDADLLIRHASGVLYQEAHRRLAQGSARSYQPSLFEDVLPFVPGGRREQAPGYVHHTPPWLARAIVQQALSFAPQLSGAAFDILDPACGSGVFLIEAARELDRLQPSNVQLRGMDLSTVAGVMTEFCVGETARDLENVTVTYEVQPGVNSLSVADWGQPDIVLMNPPFQAWRDQDEQTQKLVSQSLQERATHRPDLCFAFLARAASALKPGGVLASVVPATFFNAKSALKLREQLNGADFRVRLVGLLRGFKTFDDATVEAAIVVVARKPTGSALKTVVAKEGFAEKAARLLRSKATIKSKGIEIDEVAEGFLRNESWVIHRHTDAKFAQRLGSLAPTRVKDLFTVRLGVRGIGSRALPKVLLVAEIDYARLASTEQEQRYFRPVADEIRAGRIMASGYLFYPYGPDRRLLLTSEEEVEREVPTFYKEVLLPAKFDLLNRRSANRAPGGGASRNWWEPSEPVTTWLANQTPRIVTQEFGKRGNFAFDETGRCAVVAGHGWCWNGPDVLNSETLYSYLALLNSKVFSRLLKVHCPKLQGGQYRLEGRFVHNVPLPDLSSGNAALTAIGRQIHAGTLPKVNFLDEAVLAAYGYAQDEHGEKPSLKQFDVRLFVNQVYQLGRRDEHRAVDMIYEYIDHQLANKRFEECNAILAAIVPSRVPMSSVIALLIVTRRAKALLASRETFFASAVEALAESRGHELASAFLGKYL